MDKKEDERAVTLPPQFQQITEKKSLLILCPNKQFVDSLVFRKRMLIAKKTVGDYNRFG